MAENLMIFRFGLSRCAGRERYLPIKIGERKGLLVFQVTNPDRTEEAPEERHFHRFFITPFLS